jgi:hypothetical protein
LSTSSTTLPRSCAFSASSRSSSTGMKVCTFEPSLGCQTCSRAKLSTSSLLFDRAILFMRPPSANHRLDATVMRYAGEMPQTQVSHSVTTHRAC